MRSRALPAALALFVLAACNDTTAPTARGPAANRRIIAPSGTLDQNIDALFGLFPKGLATAGRNRWGNVKAKYQAGLTKPSQMKVAQTMLFELAGWVQEKAPEMSPPPNDETRQAAAARLTLYMSQYVYQGPATPPPVFTPGADNAVALVTPEESVTVVTPEEKAGVFLDEGSVATETIIIITENPTPYPENCSGPLQTKICQYPKFYHFSQFPHVRLEKAAKFAVCHINQGTARAPLADHDRFRLAHTKPANPADYTPGSTIVDNIEILPAITQTFALCEDVHYEGQASATGLRGVMTRLASGFGKLLTPKSAFAIDQGGGGEAFSFSDFNNVDPEGVPDDTVGAMVLSTDTTHANDHVTVTYTVSNTGTATAPTVPATIALNAIAIEGPPLTMVLTSVPVPELSPGESVTLSTEVVIPGSVGTGSYTLSVSVGSDEAFPDANTDNNFRNRNIVVDPSFNSMARRWNVGESAVCALTGSNATYCWGDNASWEFGAAGANQSSPFQPTPLQFNFAEMGRGPTPQFYCGIKADRSAICWGRSGFGMLGRGTQGGFQNAPAPMVGGIQWNEITTGRLSACGVSTTGVGYCWGSNQRGEVGRAAVPLGQPPLGNTLATMTLSPAVIDGGLTWKSVVAGWLHACGISSTGAAYCWGDNSRGQLGIGGIDNDSTHRSPAPVVGGLTFIQLSLGANHTCGITTEHRAYCWGKNFTGQVGNGSVGAAADVGSPVQIGGAMRFSYIAAGSGFAVGGGVAAPPASGQGGAGHTCALTESGEAWCWGWNAAGQLGNGTTIDSPVPVPVSPGLRFTSLSLGGTSTCGRRGDQIWCWGGNQLGQLGVGSLTNITTPTLINPPFGLPPS